MAAARLISIREFFLASWIDPHAVPPKAGLEALHAHNGEQEPEEADEKSNIDQKWSRFLQTAQDDLNGISGI